MRDGRTGSGGDSGFCVSGISRSSKVFDASEIPRSTYDGSKMHLGYDTNAAKAWESLGCVL